MKRLKLDHSKVFVSEDFISDGKILICRGAAESLISRQADIKPYLYVKNGTYCGKQFESERIPDMGLITREAGNRDGEERLSAETDTLCPMRGRSLLLAARVKGSTFAVYLDTSYWPIYELGPAFSKSKNGPISVRDNNENLLAIIMPMRHRHPLDDYQFSAIEEKKEA